MKKVESILVALERDRNARHVVSKAVVLARYLGAGLELFLGNAEAAYVQRQQYDSRTLARAREECLAASRAYLEELWNSLDVHDLKPAMDAACESPGYVGIVHKVQRSSPDLVIRGMAEGVRGGRALPASDWDLVRTCPVPLLLTRGLPWKRCPAVAAAVDISGDETPGLTHAILCAGKRFAIDCDGTLDLIYAQRLEHAVPEAVESDRLELAGLARAADVEPSEIFVIGGEPAAVIPQFAASHAYDLLVLGALTHRKALAVLVGTLTGQLLETLDSDILLVRSPSCRSPVR
jgi:universal stress protein E